MKKALALVLAAGMTLSLAACGGSTASSAASSESTAASSESTAASSESTAASSEATPAAAGEITYWSMWSNTEPQGKIIQEAADAYEASTGTHVNIEWKGRDISTIIQAELENVNSSVDLFDEDFQRISTQYNDYCLDLEDMAKAIDYDSYAVAALPAAVRNWAGSLVAIPYQPYTSGVFYNKAAFEAAGITAEPATWAEFLDCCEKLKAAGYTPLAQDDAYVCYTYGFLAARLMGQDAVSAMVKDGTWAESEGAKVAAQAIVDLRDKGYLSETCPDAYPDGENEVGFETAAMVVNASWVPSEITTNTGCDLEWGMFNFPTMEGGKDPATIANIGAQAFAINKNSKNAQAAFDFITMLTTGEWDEKIAMESSGIPADTRNENWPEMLAGVREAFNAQTGVYDWNMGLNDNADMKETVNDNCKKLFEGTLDAQGFIDAMK